LFWVYFYLLIFEGALRKWVLPGWSNALLVVRDPVVLALYALAVARGLEWNGFLNFNLILAAVSLLFSFFSDTTTPLVTLYGLRVNYLHVPLIFLIPQFMNRQDLYRVGKVLLWLSIPMTALLVAQYFSSQDHWLNLQPGGGEGNALTGARGRYRPSGTFSFITGLAAFYPLASAFLLAKIIEKNKSNWLLLIAAGTSIVVAIPCSISRQLAVTCGIVLVAAVLALWHKKESSLVLLRTLGGIGAMVILASFLPFFDEGVDTFQERWTGARGDDTGNSIMERVSESFEQAADYFRASGLTGVGVGMGSNVASKLLTGELSFLLAEDEWSRIFIEMGPLLGLTFILFRVAMCYYVFKKAYAAARMGNSLPLLIFGAAGALLFSGQWSPPTILGFAILGSGLSLAATNPPCEVPRQQQLRRFYSRQVLQHQGIKAP
jgi:hypothetical protein